VSETSPQRLSVQIRRVAKQDLKAIMAMLDAMIRSGINDIDAGWLTTGDASALVQYRLEKQLGLIALNGSDAVGFMSWKLGIAQPPYRAVRYSQIDGLWVNERSRRQGLARALWAQYLQECSRQAIRDIRISVPASATSLPFFAALGFVHTESLLTYRGSRDASDAQFNR